MKVDTEYLQFMWPMRHYLITCGDREGKSNIIAVSFCMPVSKEPPMMACAIWRSSYSRHLIKESLEYVVNVPPEELEPQVYYCGYHSGYQVDKYKETGLTAGPARKLAVPIIAECVAHIECKVRQVIETGDKNLFVGEVVEAYADEDIVKGKREVRFALGNFPQKVYGTRFYLRSKG